MNPLFHLLPFSQVRDLTLKLHFRVHFSLCLAVVSCACGSTLWAESPGQKKAPVSQPKSEKKGKVDRSGKYIPVMPDAGERGNKLTPDEARKELQKKLKIKPMGEGKFKIGQVVLDQKARTVSFPVKVNMDQHIVEYVLVTEQGKAHESIFTTTVSPTQVHLACVLLGMKQLPSKDWPKNVSGVSVAQRVNVEVTWPTNGPPKRIALSQFILKSTAGRPEKDGLPLAKGAWLYNGSHFSGPTFAAEREGSIIAIIGDRSALLNGLREGHKDDKIHVPNKAILPAKGRRLTMVLTLPEELGIRD